MNKFILLLALIGFASAFRADSYPTLWSAWKTQHKKVYGAAEELARYSIFVENYQKISKLNAEHDSATFALNKFADLTTTEFKLQYASGGFYESNKKIVEANTITPSLGNLPDSVDWRNKGAVTQVKDELQCGACWIFTVTGLLEGFYFINNGHLLSFSEQQVIDCDQEDYGCNGGYPYTAIKYVAKNGIETEGDYPYTGNQGTCKYDKSKAVTVAGGYKFVTANSTDHLKAALVDSPVSVLVEADQDAFRFFKSGVLRKDCGANIDFAVLAVGYQKIGLYEAFIVKNQWNTDWGQNGYINIATTQSVNNGQGVCGILSQPLIATN
jgi:C1A family cysteine protease